jgi:hypothetical protein
MVEITRAPEVVQRLLDSLQDSNARQQSTRHKDIHISELCYCLREAFLKRINPLPPTATELGYFTDGSRRHSIIEPLHPGKMEFVSGDKYQVTGHIDVLSLDGLEKPTPVEIKTTRAASITATNIATKKKHYIRQLGFYCVLVGSLHGRLIIQLILNKDNAPFDAFDMKFPQEEWDALEKELIWKRNLLMYALSLYHGSRDGASIAVDVDKILSFLPIQSKDDDWKCRSCRRQLECRSVFPCSVSPKLRDEIMKADELWKKYGGGVAG